MGELPTKYQFRDIEADLYRHWEETAVFHAVPDAKKKPFTIVIPPPNVTGILHMGHALNNTLQDILIRYHRMRGYAALWMPGTDHAGIATQNVVERKLAKEKITRHDLGRERFLEHVWQWKQEYGSTIIRQLKRLGCACDWQRTRFTMDDAYSDAVLDVFIRLYQKDLIYRGYYIINWCPRCETALSDEEAPHKDVSGFLYHIKYPLKGSRDHIIVATTRPETMLGDTAVAVNPKDERYRKLIGTTVIVPLMDREVPIIGDELVDPAFGTGAVKVTPAHDPNDYVMGKRHGLEFINIFHPDGRCNEQAGDYAGQDRFEAREAVVEDLKARGLLVKIEPHQHAVGHCYRCHSVVEPYYSKQWFVKMKPLSAPGVSAVNTGKIRFHPERWTKVYLNWMENIQDWCISRQIWWGHRLPVYYCADCVDEADMKKGVIVARRAPVSCPHCGGKNIRQDDDVLDTWFSSWLWPFATLGWPFAGSAASAEQQAELRYFYPTSVLVTAPEIIFFWVARMIMAGYEFMQERPFSDVYIHGTVRDDTGRKMSKSLGNSIDPLEIIDQYGADALRFSIISITAMGQDVFLSKEKFEFGRNFCNKLWNASRFIIMNRQADRAPDEALPRENLSLADAWIISKFNSTLKRLDRAFEQYRLNEAAGILYDFFWHQLCDWYIEIAKLRADDLTTQRILSGILERTLRIAHPFMPFITEALWQKLTGRDAVLLNVAWPVCDERCIDERLEAQMERLISCITVIRTLRNDLGIKPKELVDVALYEEDAQLRAFYAAYGEYIKNLARVETLSFTEENTAPAGASSRGNAASTVVFLVSAKTVDVAQEREKLSAKMRELQECIARKNALLSNEKYVAKAPAEIVAKERQSCAQLQDELAKLTKVYEELA